MLAAHASDAGRLRFPLLASPKIDGIRVSITERGPLTRGGGLLPNEHFREYLKAFIGIDGELTFGDPVAPDVVQRSIAAGMSRKGPRPEAGLIFWAFDHFLYPEQPYAARYRLAELLVKNANFPHVEIVPQHEVSSQEELDKIETLYVHMGFEGVMLRKPEGRYVSAEPRRTLSSC